MNTLRWKELLAISMIGEGVVAAFFPVAHMQLWHVGPGPLRTLVRFCEERPKFTRLLAIAEVGCGVWLAQQQFRQIRQMIGTRRDRSRKGVPHETLA